MSKEVTVRFIKRGSGGEDLLVTYDQGTQQVFLTIEKNVFRVDRDLAREVAGFILDNTDRISGER